MLVGHRRWSIGWAPEGAKGAHDGSCSASNAIAERDMY